MSFQVGIGSLGGTVLFQVALCTPLWTMDMIKIKREAVNSFKATFYKRFVGNINNRGRKGQPDQLFKTFNNNHINVNYKVEVCLEMLLDTKMIYEKNSITTKVYRDKRRLPVYWSSQIPKRYNRNAITSDLNAATRMVSVPGNEIPEIKRKFLNIDYPLRFINSVIKQFSQKSSEMDDFIVPSNWFEIPKKIVFLEIPCCPKNIKLLQSDLPKGLMNLQIFHMVYVWITKR